MNYTFEIPMADLRRVCDFCHPCRYDDGDHRFPPIKGVYFDWSSDVLNCIGTDGRQMSIVETRGDLCDGFNAAINVSLDLTKLYAKRTSLQRGGHQKMVEVNVGSKDATFKWKNSKGKETIVICPIIEGRFPNWRPVVPAREKAIAEISFYPQKWVEAWPGIPINGFELSLAAGRHLIEVAFPKIQHEGLPVEHTEGDAQICLDVAELLMPHLERLGQAKVQLRINGKADPIRLDYDNHTYILMPMHQKG